MKISASKNETEITKVLLAFENIIFHMTAFFYELFFARILFIILHILQHCRLIVKKAKWCKII